MIHDILFALWFLLPAALANAAPVFAAKLPLLSRWDAPMDDGRKFRGVELLGSHKTWRGLVSGMVVATLVLWLQQQTASQWDWALALTLPEVDYTELPVLVLGPLFGLGALGGDAVKSFFKRQRGIKSGSSWVPYDQLDYIVGAIVVTLPFVQLRPMLYAWMIVLWFGLHVASTVIGYKLGIRERPI